MIKRFRQWQKERYFNKMLGYCHFPVERREVWEDEYLPNIELIKARSLFITRIHFDDPTFQPRTK